MEMSLGMSESEATNTGWRGTDEGSKLKSIEWSGSDLSGFSGLPGGKKENGGAFEGYLLNGFWWTSSDSISNYTSYARTLFWAYTRISREEGTNSNTGFSARCVKD